ncbi:Interferon-induced protein 44-like [Merluccius polli]|uniref:Interferon-induced protein 44-like n=1 Tax=Merluccius polli TaxID=89951 RepID=A0AA47P1B9_MERPO|nr:Interferon-induced protein 44-like [Merluccius polli]
MQELFCLKANYSPDLMSVVKSSLSGEQEQKLLSLFGRVRLHLLYKASVHGFEADDFHRRCDAQGPTLLAAYNTSGYVFGAYTTKDYEESGEGLVCDDKAFLYSISGGKKKAPLRVASDDGQHGFTDGGHGPDFGALKFLEADAAAVASNPGTGFTFVPKDMHGDDLALTEFEVYRVEEFGGLLAKPWRTNIWTAEKRQGLMDKIKSYRPDISGVSSARVLLVGPVGAGKSSFFNSINSVFRGNMTSQAISGVCGKSVTTQFRTFSIKAGKGGKVLPLVLCDTMGLESLPDAGLDVQDLYNIYKGHIEDRYQFSPCTPLSEDAPGFRKRSTLKDQIHCVVYVFDSSQLLADEIVEKMAAIRKKTNQMGVLLLLLMRFIVNVLYLSLSLIPYLWFPLTGIPQLLLMTKVDEACPLVKESLADVYLSEYIYKKAQEFSTTLGIPLGCVLPVKNYSQELDVELRTDVLLLSAVQQMLHYADSFFENQVVDSAEADMAL